ncbi:MAG: hypothetical protein J4G15_08475 [Alphaproteobacteria bacterium]|nr:hypothetical protein [Alphaproteobacteria bacterium]
MTAPRAALVARLAATAEVIGSTLSEDALAIMETGLERWPAGEVAHALHRVRSECRGRLALADVLERIPAWKQSRLQSVDEAWEQALAARMWD